MKLHPVILFRPFTRISLTRCILLAVMSWALLELARNPSIQTKLREELLAYGGDPDYDQLSNSLPYLDAVVHEILRLYPPVIDVIRVVCPLLSPPALSLTDHTHVSGNGGRCNTPFRARSHSIWRSGRQHHRSQRNENWCIGCLYEPLHRHLGI